MFQFCVRIQTELIKVCVNVLDTKGGMSYLPWRFYLFFSCVPLFLICLLLMLIRFLDTPAYFF